MTRLAPSQFGVVALAAFVVLSMAAAPLTAASIAGAEEPRTTSDVTTTDTGLTQTADIFPPETQTFAPGGVYPVMVTVDVGSGSFLSSDRVGEPTLDLTIEGDATIESVQPTDYAGVEHDETVATLSAAEFFRPSTSQTAVVVVRLPESADGGSFSLTATPGDGDETASSTTSTYEITSQESTWGAMAGSAEAKTTLASSYRASYDRLLYSEPWNETVQTSMRDGFSTVIVEETKGAVLGSIPGVGTALQARDAYQVARGNYDGGTAGQIAAVNRKLKNDLDARMGRDAVRRAGNSSAPLAELEALYKEERDAWTNQNREKLEEVLLRQRAVLVDSCLPQSSSNPYANDYDTCLAIESDDQKTASLSNTGLGDSNSAMAQYFGALESFALDEYEQAERRLDLVHTPNPQVRPTDDPTAVEQRLDDLETGETTTVTFEVSNAPGAGVSGELGFLSLSHGDNLSVQRVTERTDDDANVSVDRTSPGEKALNISGEATTLAHPLVDVVTQYDPGDEREFEVTIERTAEGNAWIAYRAALQPFLVADGLTDAEAQAAFARAPTTGPTDQQGWHVRTLSTDGAPEPPLPTIDVPSNPTTADPVTLDASGSTANTTVETYAWEVDTDGDGTVDETLSGPTPSVEFDTAGTARVTLTVTDAEGRTATTDTTLRVGDATVTKTTTDLGFAVSRELPEPGDRLTFDAPSDVGSPGWLVTRDGAEVASGDTGTFSETFDTAGTYEVTLSGTLDGRDVSETHVVDVATREERVAAPAVSVSAPPTTDPGETVTVDAADSVHPHPDRGIDEYELVVDGVSIETRTDGVFEYAFETSGNHELGVRAIGSEGNVTDVSRNVTVSDGGGDPSGKVVGADGTEYATIQAAVDEAAPGERITLTGGTYNESVTVSKRVDIVAPDGATISGAQQDYHTTGVTLSADGGTVRGITVTDFYVAIDGRGVSGWTLRNVSVVGNSYTGVDAVAGANGWDLRDVTISDNIATGIEVEGDRWRVADTRITDNDYAGVSPSQSDDWTLTNVTVTGHSDPGISAYESGNWTITRSNVSGNGFNSYGGSPGIGIDAATGPWTIRRSTLVDNDVNEIDATDAGLTVDATENWWGSADGPTADDCAGAVDCGDHLTTPPGKDDNTEPLVADLSVSTATATSGEPVTFNASETVGDVTEYAWDVTGDGVNESTTNATFEYAYDEPGTYDVTVTAYAEDATGKVVSDEANVTLEIVNDSSEQNADVARLSVGDAVAVLGETVDVPVAVENANVMSYRANITFDPTVATLRDIQTQGVDSATDIDNEGGEASIGAELTDGDTPQSTLVFEVRSNETTSIEVQSATVRTSEDRLTPQTRNGTVTGEALPPIGNGQAPPTDPDDDGVYEDINGDGVFDIVDVSAFFQNRQSQTVQDNLVLFDFNDDGRVDIIDVSRLFSLVRK